MLLRGSEATELTKQGERSEPCKLLVGMRRSNKAVLDALAARRKCHNHHTENIVSCNTSY